VFFALSKGKQKGPGGIYIYFFSSNFGFFLQTDPQTGVKQDKQDGGDRGGRERFDELVWENIKECPVRQDDLGQPRPTPPTFLHRHGETIFYFNYYYYL
jgi:hypothetical protein